MTFVRNHARTDVNSSASLATNAIGLPEVTEASQQDISKLYMCLNQMLINR